MLQPPCFSLGMVLVRWWAMPGFLQTWHLAFRPKSSIFVSSDERSLVPWYESPSDTFWQTPYRLSCAFYWGVASVCLLLHTGLICGVLQNWLSFWNVLLFLQSNALSHLRGPSTPIAQIGSAVVLVLVVVVSNFFQLQMMEACVLMETFPVPFCRSVSPYNPVSEVYRQFLRLPGLVWALTCTLSYGTLQTGVYLSKSCPLYWIYHRWTPAKL